MQTETQRCSISTNITIQPGTLADYEKLKIFHYRSHRAGAVTRVLTARYLGPGLGGKARTEGLIAGVLLESLPSLACTLRSIALPKKFHTSNRSLDAALLNRDLRTIARVIVHPIFRATGLAVQLVRCALAHPQTPYIEALAAMGRVNPFFEKAGMTRFDRPPLPDVIRLLAALQKENLTITDLTIDRVQKSIFLQQELRRFSRKKTASIDALLTEARTRATSQPIYYLWKSSSNE